MQGNVMLILTRGPSNWISQAAANILKTYVSATGITPGIKPVQGLALVQLRGHVRQLAQEERDEVLVVNHEPFVAETVTNMPTHTL